MTRSAAITSGPPVSAGGSAIATARKTSMMVLPGNAGLPASISKRIAPTANRSEAGLSDLALPLLGRHVAGGPHQRPRLRQRDLGSELLRHRPREPEIQQLHAVRREKDVRGLQVAVDDAPRVQGLQRRQHPQRDPERLSDRNALAGETLLECLAFQQLHDEVEFPALFSELVDMADVGMVDACCGPGLAQQTLAQRRVSGGIPDPLDGHVAVQAVVVGGVHHSHAALAQPAGHTVAADGFRLPRTRGLVPQDIERSLVSDVEAQRRVSDGQGGIRTLETV